MVPRSHKAAALGRLLDVESPTAAIVFCRTRLEVDELTETLMARGRRAGELLSSADAISQAAVPLLFRSTRLRSAALRSAGLGRAALGGAVSSGARARSTGGSAT